jgi:hypothetical protein
MALSLVFEEAILKEISAKISFQEFRHSGGMTESSPAIYRRVCRRKRARPGGTLERIDKMRFIRPSGTGRSPVGQPGDKSPGYFQMSRRDFNPLSIRLSQSSPKEWPRTIRISINTPRQTVHFS